MHPIIAKYEGIIAMKTINTAAHRYHDICMGHRVVGHEGKCRHLHGHNYRIHFYCEPNKFLKHSETPLDSVGRVIDFSVMKNKLCMWLEENWDHKFLHWQEDNIIVGLKELSGYDEREEFIDADDNEILHDSFVSVPFNPTAENIAHYLLTVIAPQQLADTNVVCTKVVVEETAKCAVTAQLEE